ncbi:MAG: hypothetical protein RI909_273 [Bacteroidota bacterium]
MQDKKLRLLFYFIWVCTLLIQAYHVELRGDEAYYWMYSRDLAWGYFDHPPVVAVLVKLGYALFQNELGVRLFFVLLCTATIGVMEKMIQPSNLKLFYAIILSIAFLQLGMVFGGGMFAIPDFPLLFFTALFFYLYKHYLQETSWLVVVSLSVVISLLLLSKYHGILIIGFTLLSNLKLVRQKSFWVMAVLSTLLFLPHVHWQLTHDFPSIKYHFFERSSKGYSFSFTTEYLATQPFILGPFIGLLLIYLGVMLKPKDVFERSLKWMAVGTYFFFFLMTFKGRVEGNWTIITFVPLLYIGYNHIEQNERLKKITFYSFIVSLILIVVVRVCLIFNYFPSSLELSKSLGARRWSKELKEKTNGKPVAFMNSYQRASLHEFYSGVPAFSLNNVWGRKNQYSIWDTESKFQGESVAVVANYPLPQYDSILFATEYLPYVLIDNFRSTSNITIQSDLKSPVILKPSDTLRVRVKFDYQNKNIRALENNKDFPSVILYSFFQSGNAVDIKSSDFVLQDSMFDPYQKFDLLITAPKVPGDYDFYLSVSTGWLPPGINSEKIKFIVKEP